MKTCVYCKYYFKHKSDDGRWYECTNEDRNDILGTDVTSPGFGCVFFSIDPEMEDEDDY